MNQFNQVWLLLVLATLLIDFTTATLRGADQHLQQDRIRKEEHNDASRDLNTLGRAFVFPAPAFKNNNPDNGNGQTTCTYDPTNFESTVVVEFLGHPDQVTNQSIALIQEAFEEIYNTNAAGNCDSDFRTVAEVTVVTNDDNDDQRNRFLQTSPYDGPPGRPQRFSFRLLVLGNCRGCKKEAQLFNDGIRRRLSAQEYEEQQQEQEQHRDLMSIQGVTYGGAVKKVRPIDHPDVLDRFNWWKDPFDCSCEILGVGEDRTQTDEEFNAQFDGEVVRLNAEGNLPGIQRSLGVSEVIEVNCTEQDESFESIVFVDATGDPDNITQEELATLERLFLDAYRSTSDETCDEYFRVVTEASVEVVANEDDDDERRQRQLNALELLSRVGSNEQQQDRHNNRNRDRGDRDYTSELQNLQDALDDSGIDGFDVTGIGDASENDPTLPPAVNSSPRFRPFRFRFQVTGQCKGCRGDARLFNDGFRRRRLFGLEEEEQDIYEILANGEQDHRKLGWVLNGDTCFCRVGAPEGAPEQTQFAETYNEIVQEEASVENSTLTNIGSIAEVVQLNEQVPSSAPSSAPSTPLPSTTPSLVPSLGPSISPSLSPSWGPSDVPSITPTVLASDIPSNLPSVSPSESPTVTASMPPSASNVPTEEPVPTESPVPSPSPSSAPSLAN